MCCVCGREHKHHDGRVEIRGQLAGVRLLILLFGSWGWKSSPQGWEQEPLLTEPITAPWFMVSVVFVLVAKILSILNYLFYFFIILIS